MYCCHCAKKIDETSLEKKNSSFNNVEQEITSDTKVGYVCPRCGHVIHSDISKEETKSLSRAAHAELQRGRNSFAVGMGNVSIAIILLTIAAIFFVLAKKPINQFELVTDCAEFYVAMVLFAVSAVLLVFGVIYTAIGVHKNVRYSHLLKDINNETFVQ